MLTKHLCVLIHICNEGERGETGLSPPVKYFYRPFQGGTQSFVDHSCYYWCVFVMLSRASFYCCLVVTCWERADLLALVCDVLL